MLKMRPCADCGQKILAHVDNPVPQCDPCNDAFMNRGARSNPFWLHDDMALQRSVDAEIGDL